MTQRKLAFKNIAINRLKIWSDLKYFLNCKKVYEPKYLGFGIRLFIKVRIMKSNVIIKNWLRELRALRP